MPGDVRSPYGRHSVTVLGTVPDGAVSPTYYERPALKPSDWRWLIVTYFFVGGAAGAAQLIASVVDLLGQRRHRGLVSAGRYVAIGGALVSPLLLIADLKTPSRWYNMLRLFRPTSPMSIGSWTLLAFGTSSSLAVLGQLAEDVFHLRAGRSVARISGIPAGISGALLATYTGTLLSATSTPIWAVAYRWLPALFGASATATACAVLSLTVPRTLESHSVRRGLSRLALLASLVELVVTFRLDAVWREASVETPLGQARLRPTYRVGALGLGILFPLTVHLLEALTGREWRRAATVASLAALVGGYCQRTVVLMSGRQSAERPRDYFHIAQPLRARELSGIDGSRRS